ncbi:MAG: recombinase family protein [Gemmatimonadales bacterium]|nr:recombinase family protein [Gemmatimonadales bacterium]
MLFLLFILVLRLRLRTDEVAELARALGQEGVRGKTGKPIDKGALYKLLNNRTYIGEAVHKGQSFPGEHAAIIDRALWDKVHAIMGESPRKRASNTRVQTPALLKGLIFGPTGAAMSPTHTRKGGRLYRYYVSQAVLKGGPEACPVKRIPAGEIERVVVDQLRILLATPEIIVSTWQAARQQDRSITEGEIRAALLDLDPLWDELFPAEQTRIVGLLVERVDITRQAASIRLRTEGLANLVQDLRTRRPDMRRAA